MLSSRKPGRKPSFPTRFSTSSCRSATSSRLFLLKTGRRQVRAVSTCPDSSNLSATRFAGRCGFSTRQTDHWNMKQTGTRRINRPVCALHFLHTYIHVTHVTRQSGSRKQVCSCDRPATCTRPGLRPGFRLDSVMEVSE